MGMETDCNEMIARLKSIKHGESFVYFVGNLAESSVPFGDFKSVEPKNDAERKADERRKSLRAMADRFWAAHEMGLVRLVQRRVGPNKFEYIAQGILR